MVIVEDSALRVEMGTLESQEEDVPKRILWYHWSVEQLPDLFRTTHRVKTQQVDKSRGQ